MDSLHVPQDTYDAIAAVIGMPESPVGIDTTRTHVIIIQKLLEIERRLDKLEGKA